jgi:hypothetical protein
VRSYYQGRGQQRGSSTTARVYNTVRMKSSKKNRSDEDEKDDSAMTRLHMEMTNNDRVKSSEENANNTSILAENETESASIFRPQTTPAAMSLDAPITPEGTNAKTGRSVPLKGYAQSNMKPSLPLSPQCERKIRPQLTLGRRTSTLDEAMVHPVNHDFLVRSVGEIAKYAYGVAAVEVWFLLPEQGDVLVQPPGGYWRDFNSHSHCDYESKQQEAVKRLERPDQPDYEGPGRLRPGEGIAGALWWMSSTGARDENLIRTLVKNRGRNYAPNHNNHHQHHHRRISSNFDANSSCNGTNRSGRFFTALFQDNGTGRSGKFFSHFSPSSNATNKNNRSNPGHRRGQSEDLFSARRKNHSAEEGGNFAHLEKNHRQDSERVSENGTTKSAKFFNAMFGNNQNNMSNRSGRLFSLGSKRNGFKDDHSTRAGNTLSPDNEEESDQQENGTVHGNTLTDSPATSPTPRHRRVKTTGDVTFMGDVMANNRPATTGDITSRLPPIASLNLQPGDLPDMYEDEDCFMQKEKNSSDNVDDEISELGRSVHATNNNHQTTSVAEQAHPLHRGSSSEDDAMADGEDQVDDSMTFATASPTDLQVHDLRKVVWRDIREFALDPLQPPNSRTELFYRAGYTHVAGVTFSIRGQQGIVVYHAIKPDLEELQRGIHHDYLRSATDLMGAEASLMVTRTAVVEYQQEQEERKRQQKEEQQRADAANCLAEDGGLVKLDEIVLENTNTSDADEEQQQQQTVGHESDFFSSISAEMKASYKARKVILDLNCCQQQRKHFQKWKQKCDGMGLTPPPPMPNRQVAFTGASVFVTMFLIALLGHAGTFLSSDDEQGNSTILYNLPLGPMSAILSLTFGLPAAPLGQPRNILFGQLIAISIGIACNYIIPVTVGYMLSVLRTAMVASICVSVMAKCGVLHPPASKNNYFHVVRLRACFGIRLLTRCLSFRFPQRLLASLSPNPRFKAFLC